jgi:protein SCO1/2
MKTMMYQRFSVLAVTIVSLAATVLLVWLVIFRGDEQVQGSAAGPGIYSQASSQVGKGPSLQIALPDFNLTDTQGRSITRADLAGKVWIVNFIFTRCTLICPMMSAQMFQLQEELAAHSRYAEMRLVSISVDGEHDTPEVLGAFAELFHADPEHWFFLTGGQDVVWPLVIDGFGLSLEHDAGSSVMPITHSGRFVLVDRQGRIVNYYDPGDATDRAALRADVDRTLSE